MRSAQACWIGLLALSCTSTAQMTQSYVDLPALVQKQAVYLATSQCRTSGSLGASGIAKTPKDSAAWQLALYALEDMNLNKSYTNGGYQIDTIPYKTGKLVRYTPNGAFDYTVKAFETYWHQQKNSWHLDSLYGRWVEKKHLYHTQYSIEATLSANNLQHYILKGFEKIGWYDTLHYHWQINCPSNLQP